MMSAESMVFRRENGKILSGGMTISSMLMAGGLPASFSSKGSEGNGPEGLLGDAAVPAGLVVLQDHFNRRMDKPTGIKLSSEPLDESMVANLRALDEKTPKGHCKGKTRGKCRPSKKKTRKYK